MLHVVTGPPCSGKTTYIRKMARRGDLTVDLDDLAYSLGAGRGHHAGGAPLAVALVARRMAIRYALRECSGPGSECDAWIIDTMPDGEAVARYQRAGAEIVVLDPGLDECVRRARKDKRRKGTESAIMKWYDAKHEGKLGAISGNASPQSREW